MNIKNLTKTASGHTEQQHAETVVEAVPTATDKTQCTLHGQYPNSFLGLLDVQLRSLM